MSGKKGRESQAAPKKLMNRINYLMDIFLITKK